MCDDVAFARGALQGEKISAKNNGISTHIDTKTAHFVSLFGKYMFHTTTSHTDTR